MRQTFGWPCSSYQSRQSEQERAILSFWRLCYQQGRLYRMCLVGMEVGDVTVTGRWNQCQRSHFISESQKRWGRGGGKRAGGRGIRRLIPELVVNMLSLRPWCFVFVAQRLLCVRVHHLRRKKKKLQIFGSPSTQIIPAAHSKRLHGFNFNECWESQGVI